MTHFLKPLLYNSFFSQTQFQMENQTSWIIDIQ